MLVFDICSVALNGLNESFYKCNGVGVGSHIISGPVERCSLPQVS